MDISKDRLYVEKDNGPARRSAQTVYYHILDTLTKLMAPILSFTAEQLSDHYQKNKTHSIHLQQFPEALNAWKIVASTRVCSSELAVAEMKAAGRGGAVYETMEAGEVVAYMRAQEIHWQALKEIRSALLKAIEIQREKQIIKHSLEAQITIYIAPDAPFAQFMHEFFEELKRAGESPEGFFKEFMIVSQFTIVATSSNLDQTELKGLFARVEQAEGVKCPRCWQWDLSERVDHLCRRCSKIIS